jgi:DNA repair protein RAD50
MLRTSTETTDELTHMLKNFDNHLKSIEAKRTKQLDIKEKEDKTLDDLRRRERGLASTQGELKANRTVSSMTTLVDESWRLTTVLRPTSAI